MKVFWRGVEVQKGRKWTAEALAYWCATHTKEGDLLLCINSGPGDDAQILEVWVGTMPEEGEEERSRLVRAQYETKKKKGGPA